MPNNKWKEIRQRAIEKEQLDLKERRLSKKIYFYILGGLVLLFIIGASWGGWHIKSALSPVEPNKNEKIEVTIPVGSSTNDFAQILKEQGIIKDKDIFAIYMKLTNDEELQAGHYEFTQAMNADEIIQTIQAGGRPIFEDADTYVTVIEGMTLEEIARLVGEETAIEEKEILDLAKSSTYVKELEEKFPSLLEGLSERPDMKYYLEGYLFPATYEYTAGMTAEDLLYKMVASSNLVYQDLMDDLDNTYLNYHQVLSLASIIEREAITTEDRGLVSGVFYNRLAADMPLQSDITVLYALGEHKEFVTYDDLEVDSPYNLYQYAGLPPGPVDSPSREAIEAAIYPTWNDYYYFVADLDTQEIYYSATVEEHDALVEEYVNKRQRSIEEESASTEEESEETEE